MNTQVNLQEVENARQTWLESRRLGVGGSDVAAILGLSKYKSPYQLWLDKTGRSDLEDSTIEPAYWGNMLEDIVAKEYAKRNGVKIQRVNATIRNPEHEWMIANIDRAIVNPDISGNVRIKGGKLTTDRILECKTANQYLAKLWGDEQSEQVPDYYLTQVQWYMGNTGASMCGLGVLIGGQKFRSYQVQFDVTTKSNNLDVVARPARWVLGLHSVIAQAMDCEGFVCEGGYWGPMQVSFLGVGASPEIAGYAFEVLYKKLKNDRAEFIQSNLQRFKRSNKTKLADAFCDGWVANVYTKVKNLSPNHEAAEKIKAYKETNADKYSNESFKVKDRYDRSDNKAQAAMHMGASSSAEVNLFVATGHQEKNLIGANQ